MNITKYFNRFAICTFLITFASFTQAQEEINVDNITVLGKVKPIPLSLSGFSGEVLETLQRDLYVQGFSFTTPEEAQFLVSGSNSGNVQGQVTDKISKQIKLPMRGYSGASVRRQAHAFADDIVKAITGNKGIAQTKIAFKTESSSGGRELFMADFDAQNAQPITKDGTIVAAPTWVPGRLAVYYTSYLRGNPDVFYQDLSTGQRRAVASYSGLNTAAAVSPDGKKVAMILSKSGSPDVYVCDADGSNMKQLTKTKEDESSPCWSPDGQWICYATKMNERRVLAKISASGGSPQRIPTDGVRNPTEPDWSPDGKWIIFTAQMADFNICVIPAGGGMTTVLASGEDPSWAPNSRTIVYHSGRGLSLMDVPTKQIKESTRVSGINSQPSWAK